jgi:hypothetical protein
MEPIVNKEQSVLIWRTSFLSLASCLYATYRGHYSLALVPGSVFLSSINYWHAPDYSWRRYVDMAVVKGAVTYQHYYAYSAEHAVPYYTLLTAAMLFYPVGIYYYRQGDHWTSTYAHILLHVIANAGNIYLYSGKI